MEELKEIASVLLKEEIDRLELEKTIQKYTSLVLKASELDIESIETTNDVYLKNGKAIGTKWAALCLEDDVRTQKFIKGLYLAIEKKRLNSHAPIRIIYAGTGPFATLILPLLPLYTPNEIQVILMEINETTAEQVKKVISYFNFEEYIQELIIGDAANYTFNHNQQADIVISETMQRALDEEPQVAVTINIVSQMKKEVIFIPQRINLFAALIDPTTISNTDASYLKAALAFDLDTEVILHNTSLFKQYATTRFPSKTIHFNRQDIQQFNHLAFFTEIQVFQDLKILPFESGLTLPRILENLSVYEKDVRIETYYKADKHPQLVYRVIE
ncbi:hypothetical protein ACQY1Q_11640 [Tenacibaculum sp. TC6]|uniref:hypothetical protein n=1 Tax=Tenacibaculum sp. TC6 TaxID=3423223 RepID=UPI003D36E1C2